MNEDEKKPEATPAAGTDVPTPQSPGAWHEFDGVAGNLTKEAAKQTNKITGIEEKSAQKAIPWVVGGLAALGSILLIKPAQKLAETVGKIPVIGGALRAVGEAVSYVLPLVAGFLAFKAFSRPIEHYNREATETTANSGTGAKANPAEKKIMSVAGKGALLPAAVETVVMGPAKTEPQPQDPRALSESEFTAARDMSYDELKQRRIAALNSVDVAKNQAYTALMFDENQRFENRVQFIKEARSFDGAPDGESPRNKIVSALTERIGLEKTEAETLVVKAPDLRSTVIAGRSGNQDHPGGHGVTPDGNIPKELDEFARKFSAFYDAPNHAFIPIGNGKNATHYNYDDLSVTGKVEYIEKALEHVRERQSFLDSKVKISSASAGVGAPGYTYSYADYDDYTGVPWYKSMFSMGGTPGEERYPSGNKAWSNEHTFIKGINGDTKSVANAWVGELPIKGKGLERTQQGFAGYEQLLGEYKEELRQAEVSHNGQIAVFKEKAQFMDNSLNILKQHGVALIEKHDVNGQTVVDVRDVRGVDANNRTAGDSSKMQWTGSYNQTTNTLSVVKVHDEKTNRDISFAQPVIIDLNTGAGVDKVLQQLDGVPQDKAMQQALSQALKPQDKTKREELVTHVDGDDMGHFSPTTLSNVVIPEKDRTLKKPDGSQLIG